MSVPVGLGPQANKFKQVSSDDHQMAVAGWWEGGRSRSPGLVSVGERSTISVIQVGGRSTHVPIHHG